MFSNAIDHVCEEIPPSQPRTPHAQKSMVDRKRQNAFQELDQGCMSHRFCDGRHTRVTTQVVRPLSLKLVYSEGNWTTLNLEFAALSLTPRLEISTQDGNALLPKLECPPAVEMSEDVDGRKRAREEDANAKEQARQKRGRGGAG